MSRLFLDGPRCHGPTELERVHPYVASPDPPEPLQSWQPDPPAGCFDVPLWPDSRGCSHPRDAILQPTAPARQQDLATME